MVLFVLKVRSQHELKLRSFILEDMYMGKKIYS